MKWSEYYQKILWLIGLFILLFIRFYYEQLILKAASESFDQLPSFWFGAIIPLIMGLYLGLLFIKGRKIQVNKPLLLCVVIPCLILVFYSPIVLTISLMTNHHTAPIPHWMFELIDRGVLSLITGTTLMAALFSHNKNTKELEF